MTNHIHFLVTPDTSAAISSTMKVIGSRYAKNNLSVTFSQHIKSA